MFTMTITAPDGNIGGLRYIDAANWTGKGIVIPKPAFAKMKDKSEIDKPGVYILMSRSGVAGNRQPKIYIGEGDPAKTRIESHAKTQTWWNEVVIFVSANESLDKTKIQWVEAELIRRARKAGHAIIDQNTMNFPTVRPAVQAECESFTDMLIRSLAFINVDYFDVADVTPAVIEEPKKVRSVIVPPPVIPAVIPAPVTSFPETPDEEDAVYPREVPTGVVNEMLAGVELADEARICVIGDDKLISKVMHKWPNAKLYFVGVTAKHNNKIQRRYCGTVITMTQEDLFSQSAVKFDLIIGNPPYNEAPTGEGSQTTRSTIWHLFVDAAISCTNRYATMIVPARWYTGGRGLDDFRSSFSKRVDIVRLVDRPNGIPEWRESTDIKGGICHFLIDKNKTNPELVWESPETGERWTRNIPITVNEHIIRSRIQEQIVQKILIKRLPTLQPYSTDAYGIPTNAKPKKTGTPCWFSRLVLKDRLGFTCEKISDRDGTLNTYRVLSPRGSGTGVDLRVISSSTVVASPGQVCTDSYLVLKTFSSKTSANEFLDYLKTKFARYLISVLKNTQHLSADKWSLVPVIPSGVWTDQRLYQYFELTPDMIAAIEARVSEWVDDDQDD